MTLRLWDIFGLLLQNNVHFKVKSQLPNSVTVRRCCLSLVTGFKNLSFNPSNGIKVGKILTYCTELKPNKHNK